MSDKKVLTINPELFTFSNNNNNKTRKSKPKEPSQERIRVKKPINRKQDTLRKQSLLKMIRKNQEDRYKRLISNNDKGQNISTSNTTSHSDKFNSDFDEAREYLNKLTKKNEMNVPKNTTLRKYPDTISNQSIGNINVNNSKVNVQDNNLNLIPQYGCLKNGNLPTYRNFMNRTQNNRPKIQIGNNTPLVSNIPNLNTSNVNYDETLIDTNNESNTITTNNIIENKLNESMKRMSELKQQQAILNKIKKGGKPKKLKRKKTLRRTYKIGRSSVAPKVSVLVSNKTLRNRVTTKSQLLKQTPIQEVRKYLIKHGIIRVGSTTPNDILRKMYESLSLVCGEIQNHNPDTLLFNYINGAD